MHISIYIARNSPNRRFLEDSAEMGNFAQSYFFYDIKPLDTDILIECQDHEGKVVYKDAIIFVRNKFGEKCIYVTDTAFDNDYFSYTGPQVAIVTTSDWSEKHAPPLLTAFLAYELVQSSICFSANVTDEDIDRIYRRRSIGCLFDFCNDKSEIRFGLVAGYISPETKAELSRHRVTEEALGAAERILEYIRLDSIGRPFVANYNEAFVVMKFSENDENANAYEHGIKPALKDFGLVPTRADDDPRMQMLSQKVLEHIAKCRIVVIKVDEPNQNVYFELGYAVAKRKDILLICRSSQLRNVPTDIKGWELLVYADQDFTGLKRKIAGYLENILPHRRADS